MNKGIYMWALDLLKKYKYFDERKYLSKEKKLQKTSTFYFIGLLFPFRKNKKQNTWYQF